MLATTGDPTGNAAGEAPGVASWAATPPRRPSPPRATTGAAPGAAPPPGRRTPPRPTPPAGGGMVFRGVIICFNPPLSPESVRVVVGATSPRRIVAERDEKLRIPCHPRLDDAWPGTRAL